MGIFSSRSKMKKMGEQSGYEVRSLDHRMYLLLPKEKTDRVIISAHGGRSLTNANSFEVPDKTTLRFYSADKNTVLDPGFSNFYTKDATPKETLTAGDTCFDYMLSKYQGSHNRAGETYDSISNVVNSELAFLKNSLSDAERAKEKGNTTAEAKLRRNAGKVKMAAVLTIRNRYFRADVSLQQAVALVRAEAPQIEIFDCLFCRWARGGTDEAVPLTSRT